ncbi:hypothetical protein QBC43DRAFT_219661 [Cladorrhinum sp. PSN259]|nr:hypothetical protein QBC43DRAFT_219661 [Cladorrhinum sp. PSN259]
MKPTGSKSSKHGSFHSSSSKSHKHRDHHHHPGRSSSSSVAAATTTPDGRPLPTETSFLFIVNELQINLEPPSRDEPVLRDQWFNTMPPQSSQNYTSETVGTVFRYRSGIVTPAPNYTWYRPESWGTPGRIVRIDPATNLVNGYPIPYDNDFGTSTQTIFSCSPHLPVIVSETDATLGTAFMRRFCRCDGRYSDSRYTQWNILHFESGGDAFAGISFVNAKSKGYTSVVGRDPAWMPSLVPATYRNSATGGGGGAPVPDSRGLSGQLPTVIGLMGFHGAVGRVSEVFGSGRWQGNRWNGSGSAPRHVPRGGDDKPRGFLVQVCMDNLRGNLEDNEYNNFSTEACYAKLQELEWRRVLVSG